MLLSRWGVRTLSSLCTPPAAQESPRGWCTHRQATSSTLDWHTRCTPHYPPTPTPHSPTHPLQPRPPLTAPPTPYSPTHTSQSHPHLIARPHLGPTPQLTIPLLCLQLVFDYRPGDVFACVADIGWITGHSCVVYGPLCNAATSVLFESVPMYPDPGEGGDHLLATHPHPSPPLPSYPTPPALPC